MLTKNCDFAELTAVTNELAAVNRLQALQAIFAKVTAGAATDEAKQLKVFAFLQNPPSTTQTSNLCTRAERW